MLDIWTSLIPILLADVLNPVLFAFMVYAAGSDRPVLNSSIMLVGHTTAYLSVGIALAFGMDGISLVLLVLTVIVTLAQQPLESLGESELSAALVEIAKEIERSANPQ